jgi:hypothetical protein
MAASGAGRGGVGGVIDQNIVHGFAGDVLGAVPEDQFGLGSWHRVGSYQSHRIGPLPAEGQRQETMFSLPNGDVGAHADGATGTR